MGEYTIRMTGPSKDLLDRIEELADDQKALIYDAEVNRALEPLRRAGPFQVRCGKPSCHQTLSWWALDQQVAIVLSAKRRKMKKDSAGLGGINEFVDPDPNPAHGFALSEREAMVEDQTGRKAVHLAENPGRGVTGVTTRRTWTCGKCGQEYPRKNSTMLKEFVTAANSKVIKEIVL